MLIDWSSLGGDLVTAFGETLLMVGIASLLAIVIGLPLGLAMGMSPMMRGIFDPPIEFYRPIPPLAPMTTLFMAQGPARCGVPRQAGPRAHVVPTKRQ